MKFRKILFMATADCVMSVAGAVSDSLQPSGLLDPVYMRVSVDRMRLE